MSSVKGAKVIVVGGGLAGLSAAHTVLEHGGRVLLLDKKDFMGGNSVKATSGINGALTSTQINLKIPDTKEQFERDTTIGAKLPQSTPLIKVLTHESGPAVEWLIENFKLDLSLISRLGGHSQPRTHRGRERFPGMTITYALMEKFEEIAAAEPERAQVIVNATARRLLTEGGDVVGVEYEWKGKTYQERGPVVLATGGFGADFSDDSILRKVRPDLLHLPTTNGDHCTGDGIKMVQAVNGATIDLPQVQVHPTGLVHPNEPDAKIKWLAAEALRGVGGLLLTNKGKRFCNELGTRDYVSGEMFKFKAAPYRLVLNSKGTKEIEWHCKHYVGRGLMKHFKSGRDLAKEMGISVDELKATFDKYNAGTQSGKDEFGKKYFTNAPFDINDEFHVAIVTPVVHYCMGGIQIDDKARVVRREGEDGSIPVGSGTPIPGLYAGGECAGGVHGKNRLGGSGLLGAVVYGRVAGASVSKYFLDQLSSEAAFKRAGAVAGHLFAGVNIQSTPQGLVVKLEYPGQSATSGAVQQAVVESVQSEGANAPHTGPAEAPQPVKQQLKEYSLEEIAKHNTEANCWVIVNGQVLNATPFLNKHPGGKEAILLYAGKDASAEFNMLHKPDVVQKYAPEIIIGTVKQ